MAMDMLPVELLMAVGLFMAVELFMEPFISLPRQDWLKLKRGTATVASEEVGQCRGHHDLTL